jgi:hypothetical protein
MRTVSDQPLVLVRSGVDKTLFGLAGRHEGPVMRALAARPPMSGIIVDMKRSSPATGEYTMSSRITTDISALFGELGIDVRDVDAGLVIERFELWGRESAGHEAPMRGTICRMDLMEAA